MTINRWSSAYNCKTTVVGFDFYPNNVKNLLKAVEDTPELHEDDRGTKLGSFMASNSKGMSFRQEGEGQVASLHYLVYECLQRAYRHAWPTRFLRVWRLSNAGAWILGPAS